MSDERRLLPARRRRPRIFRRMVRKSSTPSRTATRAARARTKANPRTTSRKRQPDLRQGWSLEARLLAQRGEPQAQGQEQGQRRQGQERWQHSAAGEQGQEECEALEVQHPGSEEEAELVGCGESVSPPSFGETTLNGFFLTTVEEEAELHSFESKTAGVLVTGTDSGAARSVVPACEIPGCPVERASETGRVYTSATGERVFDQGRQQILGIVDGTVSGLNMRVTQVKKSLTSVYDMCAAGHRVVFDFDNNKRDLSHAENKLTGERTFFKLRDRVWELEVKIIPKAEHEDILTKMQEQDVEELCPFEEQVFLP